MWAYFFERETVMDKEKLQRIIEFNKKNSKEILSACSEFYNELGRDSSFVIPDIQSVARTLFMQKGYKFMHIPFVETEIGAYQLKLNKKKYLVINTSKHLANNNFAVAHEIYHLLIQQHNEGDGEEVYLDTYDDNEDEQMANAFAGNILMPQSDFMLTYGMFSKNIQGIIPEGTKFEREIMLVLGLMGYYKTTYMSVVVRCFELGVFDIGNDELVEYMLEKNDEETLTKVFEELSKIMGAKSIMQPTYEDDYSILVAEVKEQYDYNYKHGLITKEDYDQRLAGMENAYQKVKRED